MCLLLLLFCFFFFNDTATTEIYTLSLHDALPISLPPWAGCRASSARTRANGWPTVKSTSGAGRPARIRGLAPGADRKSTRLNSSHANISYAVFCLKKKKKYEHTVIIFL